MNRGNDYFTTDDRHFITCVAGTHPYLLQAAASALWEVYEDGEEDSAQRLELLAGQQFYDSVKLSLDRIWPRYN